MSKFYCNKCEHEVYLKDGICPNCNTDWGDEIGEENIDKYDVDNNEEETKEELIENNAEALDDNKSTMDSSSIVKNSSAGNKNTLYIILAIIGFPLLYFILTLKVDYSPTEQIEADIKRHDFIYGYGTRYDIGKVSSVSCSEYEKDGNGRYLIKCNISYYPKRLNGAVALDSEMNEIVYAAFYHPDNDSYVRIYTSYPSSNFKTKVCWGKDKSYGIICN